MPSDAELERDVRETLRGANMDEMSLKLIRKQLEAKWQMDLSSKKAFLKATVTKAVWAYIRAESLQDPKDRRKIRNDDKMFKLFKCKNMNMMQIAKKLSPHLKKYSDLIGADDGGGGSKKRASGGGRATPMSKSPSPAPKGRPKKNASNATKPGAKPKGRGKALKEGDEAPVKRTRAPSTVMWKVTDELAAVVGSKEATIDEIRSGVHLYIKKHNLQDPSNRTIVICDDTLEEVMGQKVVKMFGMQSLISPHRLYKI
eukprot:jgi/Undpi1/10565/HiC_scaffold_29.g13015.m1